MSYVGVPTVPRDSTIASSMIVQDYISKRFRGEKSISRRHMPKGVDSCFGNFPMQYKTKDAWDGNPTLRRDSRTSYTSPQRSPTKTRRPKGSDVREKSGVIPGVGARPATAGSYRRSSTYSGSSEVGRSGLAASGAPRMEPATRGRGLGGGTGGGGGARPKSASVSRSRPFLEVHGSSTQQQQQQQQQRDPGGETRTAERGGEGGVPSLASTEKCRKATRVRPKTAGATPTSRGRKGGGVVLEDLPDRQELEATRTYLLTQGKFRITPSKLMASLEVARATNSRPLSAPASVRRRRAPAPPKAVASSPPNPRILTTVGTSQSRGRRPVALVDHCGHRNAIRWKVRPADLDFHVYLPIFFDGLREASYFKRGFFPKEFVEDPYRFLAVQGTLDMIEGAPDKVLPVIPQLVLPMKTALNTREPRIICPTLKILQQMILLSPMIGQALVPYYRQV
ncbi:unnamed protein product, partial [Ectocarpus sp. 8 AP-2014]